MVTPGLGGVKQKKRSSEEQMLAVTVSVLVLGLCGGFIGGHDIIQIHSNIFS